MYLNCSYPGCGNGHCVGSKFCSKHIPTPFYTKEEINAYKRGIRDERKRIRSLLSDYSVFIPELLERIENPNYKRRKN